MDDRKLIVIPAVPSGGTSALAGVLYHLGIDMGNFSLEAQSDKRGYEMFEDKEIALFCSRFEPDHIPMAPKLMSTRCRWRNYVNHRFMGSEGPQGLKLPAVLMIQDDDIASLPVVYLNIERPLEDSIKADIKRMAKKGEYGRNDIRSIQTFHMIRAADISANWWAKKEILSLVEPELSLTFNELVKHPRKSVENIIVALQQADLGCEFLPTRKQREQAILFLDKDKKSI
jgi:hypothetical protein